MTLDQKRKLEIQRLEELRKRQPTTDDFPGTGVVLSDGIEFYCNQFDLIKPFKKEHLKPAYYKLSVGDQCSVGGIPKNLADGEGRDEIVIPPFEVAILKTLEIINMPRFLIGRWNIQVPRAYQGLLWVGGPQVDAGYVGHLYCPIYNLSHQPVTIRYSEPIAVIDFVKTTEVHAASLKYEPISKWVIFEDYPVLRSALAEQLSDLSTRMEQLEARTSATLERFESRAEKAAAAVGFVLTIVVAALAVISTSQFSTAVTFYTAAAFLVSVCAVVIALIAYFVRD
ncbi:MAG: hypothetical protein AB7O65_09265 [Candidatus Korobacteraceae bacterium]